LRADCWRMRMVARCSITFLFVFVLPLVVALQLHYERRLDELQKADRPAVEVLSNGLTVVWRRISVPPGAPGHPSPAG